VICFPSDVPESEYEVVITTAVIKEIALALIAKSSSSFKPMNMPDAI